MSGQLGTWNTVAMASAGVIGLLVVLPVSAQYKRRNHDKDLATAAATGATAAGATTQQPVNDLHS